MLADGRASAGRGPYPRWGGRALADGGTGGLRHGRSNAAGYQLPPLAPVYPRQCMVAALDYQDMPDEGTRTSLGSLADPF